MKERYGLVTDHQKLPYQKVLSFIFDETYEWLNPQIVSVKPVVFSCPPAFTIILEITYDGLSNRLYNYLTQLSSFSKYEDITGSVLYHTLNQYCSLKEEILE